MNKKWYPEALYLLAMLDYISRINEIPICTKHNQYRLAKLNDTIYPANILAQVSVSGDASLLEESKAHLIPGFIRFNIVENEVFDIA